MPPGRGWTSRVGLPVGSRDAPHIYMWAHSSSPATDAAQQTLETKGF